MAGHLRYWKEKGGRFWAQIAALSRLRPFLEKPLGELLEPLGADRRAALRLHPAAVARLQLEIATAGRRANVTNPSPTKPSSPRTPISTADFGRAVWQRYSAALEADDTAGGRFPSKAAIASEYAKFEETGRSEPGPLERSHKP